MQLSKDQVGVVIVDGTNALKYKMTSEFSVENVQQFVNDYLAGKLKNFIKSAPIPESNDGPVKVVVGENFKDVVMDPTKDVLIEFYAPWCGHCKHLAPIYEKLASVFKLDAGVVIGNVDADKYKDLGEKYGVTGFPTLKFFPKGNKAGEDYDGGRELGDFTKFINEKCGTNRDINGQLTSEAGRIASLDALAKEFLGAASDKQKEVLSSMEEEVAKLSGSAAKHGKVYVTIAKKILEKGNDYTNKETERLHRILEKSISPSKADEFTIKKNVLSAFSS